MPETTIPGALTELTHRVRALEDEQVEHKRILLQQNRQLTQILETVTTIRNLQNAGRIFQAILKWCLWLAAATGGAWAAWHHGSDITPPK